MVFKAGIDDAFKLVDQVDTCSFDVFDTAVVRKVLLPGDVSLLLGEQLKDPSFARRRKRAAWFGGWMRPGKDLTLDEIYQALSDRYDLKREEALEVKLCKQNKEIFSLYRYALQMKKRVIFVSDMHLSTTVVTQILHNAGYVDFTNLYISSAIGSKKLNGTLYKHVLKELDLTPERLLHIGDNVQSDIVQARKLGIKTFHYRSLTERLGDRGLFPPTITKDHGKRDISQAVLGALCAERLSEERTAETYWQDLGYCLVGPLALGFCRWLHAEATQAKVSRLYFLSRDGELFFKVFRRLYPEFDARYFFCSRRSLLLPSLDSVDDELLFRLADATPSAKVHSVFRHLDLDSNLLKAKFQEIFPDPEETMQSGGRRLREFFLREQRCLKAVFDSERQLLLRYLQQEEFLDDSRKGVVDVGWRASCQRYLEKIVARAGSSQALFGWYLGTVAANSGCSRSKGYLFSDGFPSGAASTVLSATAVVELLFSGTHNSVVRYTDHGREVRPKLGTDNGFENDRIAAASQLHDGALEFVERVSGFEKEYDITLNPSKADLTEPLEHLLRRPRELDVSMVGSKHCSVSLSATGYEPIVPDLEGSSLLSLFLSISTGKVQPFWLGGILARSQLPCNAFVAFSVSRWFSLCGNLRLLVSMGYSRGMRLYLSRRIVALRTFWRKLSGADDR